MVHLVQSAGINFFHFLKVSVLLILLLTYQPIIVDSSDITIYEEVEPSIIENDTYIVKQVKDMTKAEIQQYVYDFFYDKGLPHITICAIMGNITAESGWNPDAIESGSGIGFGLCQWSFGRRDQIESYGTSLQHQCEFLWSELTGENTSVTGANYQWIANCSDSVDNGEGFTFSNADFLAGNGSLATLTKAFCYCWERPAYATNHLSSTRIPSAEDFYNTMTYQGSGPDNPDPPEPDEPEEPGVFNPKKNSFNFLLLSEKRRKTWKSRRF